MRFIRRNAIALTALVLVMMGTGVAASGYLTTSTSRPSAPIHATRRKPSQPSSHRIVAESPPAVSSSQGPSPQANLPRVSASGATVSALWQLRLIYPNIVGDTVVGLAGADPRRPALRLSRR